MTTSNDPTELIASLDPEAIRSRLAELNAEESALRLLLRVVLARSRGHAGPVTWAWDKPKEPLIPTEVIEQKILFLRGEKIMLSTDLAKLYRVEPRTLVQAVKRNIERFPPDFMFQLTQAEFADLKSQIVISGWGGARRATPYAFTENGVAMLSRVLNSERAIRVNVEIMRTFTRLRRLLASHAELARKLDSLEKRYDAQFKIVFDAIRELMAPPPQPKKGRIGFHVIQSESK